MMYKIVFCASSLLTINIVYPAQAFLRMSSSKYRYTLPLVLGAMHSNSFSMTFSQDQNGDKSPKKTNLIPQLLPRKIKEIQVGLQLNLLQPAINILLLHGEPGTGKTECAQHLAQVGGYEFVPVKSSGLITKLQGSGAEAITQIIENAKELYVATGKKSLIFFDEIDAIGKQATKQASSVNSEVETTLMQLWQYLSEHRNDPRFIFCFATNKLSSLHPTFKDRFSADSIIEFKLPEAEERQRLLKHYFEKYNFSLETDLGFTKKDAEKALAQYVSDSKGLSHRAIALSVESLANSRLARSLSDQDLAKLLNLTAEDLKNLPVGDQEKWGKMSRAEKLSVIQKNILGSNIPPVKLDKDQLSKILKANQGKGGSSWYAIDFGKVLNTTATVTTIISHGLNIYLILTGKGNQNPQDSTKTDSPKANN